MAGRNRKNTPDAGYIPVPLAISIIVAATLGLSYIWMQVQCEAIGRQMTKMDAQLKEQKHRLLAAEARWESMKAPGAIEKALKIHNLHMTWPSSAQVVKMNWADVTEALASPGVQARRDISRVAVNDR